VWCDLDDWVEADIEKRPWIAPGRLLRGTVTLVTGPPSGMKSSLMLAWGCALALGIDVGRFHPVAAGVSIIYNVEDDATEHAGGYQPLYVSSQAQPQPTSAAR
jgi:hypothetical protein